MPILPLPAFLEGWCFRANGISPLPREVFLKTLFSRAACVFFHVGPSPISIPQPRLFSYRASFSLARDQPILQLSSCSGGHHKGKFSDLFFKTIVKLPPPRLEPATHRRDNWSFTLILVDFRPLREFPSRYLLFYGFSPSTSASCGLVGQHPFHRSVLLSAIRFPRASQAPRPALSS